MPERRLHRFVAGLSLGYLHTAAALIVGVFLTPYLLGQLGAHDYGLWLLAAQVVAYLALADVGVVALVPREIAFAVGQGHGEDSDEVRALVGRTLAVVWWQVPCVGLVAAATWWLLPSAWSTVNGPLAFVFCGFVVLFPMRVYPALLQGLQDLGFLGVAQLAGLLTGTLITLAAVRGGFELYALSLGWIAGQMVPAVLAWIRLRVRHAAIWPRSPVGAAWVHLRAQFSRGAWISVSQIAQALLSGTDLLVVGALMGPEAAVIYACTGKLVALLANQPQLLLQTALPALSELRGAAARERLDQVSRSMTQLLFVASGGIVAVVLVANKPFVTWWVGAANFGGLPLTAALLACMFVRQVNFAAIYTLFCFGHERRLAITGVADGVVGALFMVALVPWLGPIGAALGLIGATLTVSLPANLRALGREMGSTPVAFLSFWKGWALRLAVMVLGAGIAAVAVAPAGWWTVSLTVLAVAVVYAIVMVPELARPPLGPMLAARLGSLGVWIPVMPRPVATSSAEPR
jgi:O-antigen/teichoic acid export membrane protein